MLAHTEALPIETSTSIDAQLRNHIEELSACQRCRDVTGPVVTGGPVASSVVLIGQAPGTREGAAGKPFAWTAGNTLFRWFATIGLDEATFRQRIYMAAVCRCFPGKAVGGGDRVPNGTEIANCSSWLATEMRLLEPRLVIPIGRLAIEQTMRFGTLTDVVGRQHRVSLHGIECDAIPLPHPSGASTWHRTEPGKSLLIGALCLISEHPAWHNVMANR